MRGGGTGPAQGELGGFAAGQEHAEPAGADGAGAGRRGTLQEDRGGHRATGCPAGGPVPGLARGAAGADRAGRGRDGRSPARPPGRPLLPWVLSQLLLPAALYLLRPAVAGGAPADGGPGRGGWHGGGAGAHRGADPEALARGRDLAARALYEEVYCARGDMENRIKEQQLALFADRTSAQTMRASVRAVRLSFDEGFPEAGLFGQVLARLQSLPLRC